MNNSRRNVLKQALRSLENANDLILSVRDDEQIALDSMPENLQSSYRYEQMENGLDELDDAVEQLNGIIEQIDEVIS